MARLLDDINESSNWISDAFESDGYNLDYSICSLIEIDRFFYKNLTEGKPKLHGRLNENYGAIIFAISSYLANTIIKNVPNSILCADDNDVNGELNFSVKFQDGTICYPAQRVIKRVKNGLEDGIYPYGYEIAKDLVNENFDKDFWEIGKKEKKPGFIKRFFKIK